MEFTLYGSRIYDKANPSDAGLTFQFTPWPKPPRDERAWYAIRIEVLPEDTFVLATPSGAELVDDKFGMQRLTCEIEGIRHALTPSEVYALAGLKQHGFRFKE